MQLPAAYCRDPHRNRSGAPYDPQVIAGMEAFGRSVFAARKRAGLRQVDLARLCGLHQTTISRIENGVLPSLVFWRLASLIGALGAYWDPPRFERNAEGGWTLPPDLRHSLLRFLEDEAAAPDMQRTRIRTGE